MKKLKILGVLITLMLMFQSAVIAANKKVLMVVSSYGVDKGETKPGYEFGELTKAYLVFKSNGIDVDVASPLGGSVEADEYDPKDASNAKVLADNSIMEKLSNTLKTTDVNSNDYDGVFIVGGKGAMFDLPKDKKLQQVIANIYQQKGSVAAVCHGPAALVDVKLSNGDYLIADKKVNGFTNDEEKLFGKKWAKHFDFMLEDKLVERGGKFQSSDIMLNHVAVDGRLITGQNPTSTTGVANELVKSMGINPVAPEVGLQDKTLAEIAKVLDGDKTAIINIAENQEDYQVGLVGMYGFHYLKIAESKQQISNALTLMKLAQNKLNNPRLDMKIATAQKKIGKIQEAKSTLKNLLEGKPDFKPAKEMLATL